MEEGNSQRVLGLFDSAILYIRTLLNVYVCFVYIDSLCRFLARFLELNSPCWEGFDSFGRDHVWKWLTVSRRAHAAMGEMGVGDS